MWRDQKQQGPDEQIRCINQKLKENVSNDFPILNLTTGLVSKVTVSSLLTQRSEYAEKQKQ